MCSSDSGFKICKGCAYYLNSMIGSQQLCHSILINDIDMA